MNIQLELMSVSELRGRWMVVGWMEPHLANRAPDSKVIAVVQQVLGNRYLVAIQDPAAVRPLEGEDPGAAVVAAAAAEEPEDQEPPCPGCGCVAGEGRTPGCNHPEGCGYWESMEPTGEPRCAVLEAIADDPMTAASGVGDEVIAAHVRKCPVCRAGLEGGL